MMELRPYQIEAVQAALARKMGIIQAPTGSGKSVMLAGIVAKVPGRWLLIVHRRILRDQLVKALRKVGVADVAAYAGVASQSRVLVATWQGLWVRRQRGDRFVDELLRNLAGFALDECHIAPAPRLSQLLSSIPSAYKLGFSATPLLREDGLNHWTRLFFGGVIYRVAAPGLVDEGALAKPLVKFAAPGQRPIHGKGYKATIVQNQERNQILARLAAKTERPVLVLVTQVEHGEAITKLLTEEHGMRAAFLWQASPDALRNETIAKLRTGELDAIVASPIFDVGVDIPELRSGVVASGGKSAIACMQRLGRVMRPAPGKSRCTLWDIADDNTPTMQANAAQRAEAYSMCGFDVSYVEGVIKPRKQRDTDIEEAPIGERRSTRAVPEEVPVQPLPPPCRRAPIYAFAGVCLALIVLLVFYC